MSCPFSPDASRRGFFRTAAAGVLAAAAGAPALAEETPSSEPFHGPHQGGIATPQQKHVYFVALDLTAKQRDDVTALLRAWTMAAARLTRGLPAGPISTDVNAVAADGGDTIGLPPARLTLTFGFGAGLFMKDGRDRYGLAVRRPAALVDLPVFHGDQLDPARSGGDLCIQACADDPQVAFHAVRELVRLAYGRADLRWAQTGFLPDTPAGETGRNLMGFKDGTNNPHPDHAPRADVPRRFDDVVWVGAEGPDWLRGGSYLVVRRIRISLEHWDRTEVDFQEEVIGRHKYSGAPIGKAGEFDALDLASEDQEGNLVIKETAHVRLGAAAVNDGAQILRRAYSYNDGANFTALRWPPWRQGMMYDAGLFFLAWQRDPRSGFIKIFENMSRMDALNQFTTHNGSALFVCPGGIAGADFVGQRLFEAS